MTEHGRIGIEFISMLGMPPVEFVSLAAALGVKNIGMALQPILQKNPIGYPGWSLREDAKLRRETVAALHDLGIVISVGEGFLGWPHNDAGEYAEDLDLMAELKTETRAAMVLIMLWRPRGLLAGRQPTIRLGAAG